MTNQAHVNAQDRVIVIGVGLKSEPLSEIKENLLELEELVSAAGGEVVGSIIQVLPQWNPSDFDWHRKKWKKWRRWFATVVRTLW